MSESPAAALRDVVVGIVEDGADPGEHALPRVLIAKKRVVAGHFLSGAWHVPGGRVEAGEALEDAIRRELREETGLEVAVRACIGVIALEQHGVRAHWYLCSPQSGQLSPGDDVVEVEYVTRAEAARRFPPDSGRSFPDAVRSYFGL